VRNRLLGARLLDPAADRGIPDQAPQ
jgi:hypothetical protein